VLNVAIAVLMAIAVVAVLLGAYQMKHHGGEDNSDESDQGYGHQMRAFGQNKRPSNYEYHIQFDNETTTGDNSNSTMPFGPGHRGIPAGVWVLAGVTLVVGLLVLGLKVATITMSYRISKMLQGKK
jgi:hypothetical protein